MDHPAQPTKTSHKITTRTMLMLVLFFILLVLLVAFLPDFISHRTDFIMLYSADLGLVNGIGTYDHSSQVDLLHSRFGEQVAGIEIPYYIYPPWLAIGTFYLGFLSPENAAPVWFMINLLILAASVHLLTRGWGIRRRAGGYLLVFLALPTLGLMIVGQYAAPVLLGVALILAAQNKKSILMTSFGLILLTLKPHLGIGLLAFSIIWLLLERKRWAYRALLYSAGGILLLLAISFLVDPAWLGSYLTAINEFRALPTYQVCEQCSSISILGVRLFLGAPYSDAAFLVGSLAFLVLLIWLIWRWRRGISIEWLIFWAIFATLISNPYLNNYDYILLTIPLLYLLKKADSLKDYLPLILAFAAPWIGMVFVSPVLVAFGLAVSAIIVLFPALIEAQRDLRHQHA